RPSLLRMKARPASGRGVSFVQAIRQGAHQHLDDAESVYQRLELRLARGTSLAGEAGDPGGGGALGGEAVGDRPPGGRGGRGAGAVARGPAGGARTGAANGSAAGGAAGRVKAGYLFSLSLVSRPRAQVRSTPSPILLFSMT